LNLYWQSYYAVIVNVVSVMFCILYFCILFYIVGSCKCRVSGLVIQLLFWANKMMMMNIVRRYWSSFDSEERRAEKNNLHPVLTYQRTFCPSEHRGQSGQVHRVIKRCLVYARGESNLSIDFPLYTVSRKQSIHLSITSPDIEELTVPF